MIPQPEASLEAFHNPQFDANNKIFRPQKYEKSASTKPASSGCAGRILKLLLISSSNFFDASSRSSPPDSKELPATHVLCWDWT